MGVPSDKGLSKQGQNRKRRDHPDSARLAESGVVPGPTRSRDRLSSNSPTSVETAQADLLTQLSPQPGNLNLHTWRLSKDSTKREDLLKRLLDISHRQSSAGVYESKWKVFGEWCHSKQTNPVKATVQQLADFLIFLLEKTKLAT